MDNPQETKKLNNLQWLAGFFDAEGSVSFNYKPNLDIVNTCPKTIFEIKTILKSIGVDAGVNKREKPSKSSKRKRWDIFLRHSKQVKPFLNYVRPYVYGKKKQLEIIQEWYSNRNAKLDYADKIKFANQLNHIIVSDFKEEIVKKKLNTNSLHKYRDIHVLTEKDGIINLYNDFNKVYYISGLIDGDGCFNMNVRNTKYGARYTPQILMVNTNKEIVKRYCSFLKNNNIGYHISFRIAGKTTNRRRWDVLVSGVKRCNSLCILLENSLKTKKEQCKLLNQYCEFRLNNPKSKNDIIGFECKEALQLMRKQY